jgi:hypothetical protein
MNGFGEVLVAARRGTLKLQAVVITDWRDGPIEGIARLSIGDDLWKFELFAESADSEDLSDRLFLLAPLPEGSVRSQISDLIADARLPLVWPFDDRPDADSITSAVDRALESAGPAHLVISATDFQVAHQAWLVEPDSDR